MRVSLLEAPLSWYRQRHGASGCCGSKQSAASPYMEIEKSLEQDKHCPKLNWISY